METLSHILVVDDDPEIRRLLGKYLDGQGFRVTLAGSRAEPDDAAAVAAVARRAGMRVERDGAQLTVLVTA